MRWSMPGRCRRWACRRTGWSFVNGRFAPGLSHLREMPDRALIASLDQALLTHPEWIEPYLDRLPGLAQHPFAALNTAFWEDGAFVHLSRGTVVETPIHLIFHAAGGDIAVYPRLLLVLDEGAQATVVVEYQGTGRYLNAPVTEAQLGDGAVLHYHQIQQESPQAFHLGGIRLQQGRNSEANLHLLSVGGQLARTDLEALLDGEGASCTLNGLTLARDQQFSDVHVRVEHAQPHGSSQQLFKSVLDGKARTVFDGMIHVRPHAQKTDARQVSRNLLLSRQAQANANPRLEILADDVKCGHGSTTGFLDPDAEFYLRARGIGAAQARAIAGPRLRQRQPELDSPDAIARAPGPSAGRRSGAGHHGGGMNDMSALHALSPTPSLPPLGGGLGRGELDLARIRADFPILRQRVHGKPLVYLDNAASVQKPKAVIDAISDCYSHYYANIHRGVHLLSERSTAAYEGAREKVRAFLNAASVQEIIFTRSTTESINLVASSFGGSTVKAGDEIVITGMEHHSNIVPWQLLCERTGATLQGRARSPTPAN